MSKEIDEAKEKIKFIGESLYRRWGNESYNERCANYDVGSFINKQQDQTASLKARIKELEEEKVNVIDSIRNCQNEATGQAKNFEKNKMIESQNCSEAMAFAYGICLNNLK